MAEPPVVAWKEKQRIISGMFQLKNRLFLTRICRQMSYQTRPFSTWF